MLGADTYIKDLTRQQITDAVYNKEGAKTPKTKLEYFVSLKAMLNFGAKPVPGNASSFKKSYRTLSTCNLFFLINFSDTFVP